MSFWLLFAMAPLFRLACNEVWPSDIWMQFLFSLSSVKCMLSSSTSYLLDMPEEVVAFMVLIPWFEI